MALAPSRLRRLVPPQLLGLFVAFVVWAPLKSSFVSEDGDSGMALDAPADELRGEDGVFVGSAGARTIADVALYAHGSGALPPGVEGGLDAQAVYR